MVASNVAANVDYALGLHLSFLAPESDSLASFVKGFLATTKLDAKFIGKPAHAGACPQDGRNALLAACVAVQNLHAINIHSHGTSCINVGTINGGTGRSVIAAEALIKLETRGETSDINTYMSTQARSIIESAANMYGVEVSISEQGEADGGDNDLELSQFIENTAKEMQLFNKYLPICDFGASEDFTCFMEAVQKQGGQAGYIMVGANRVANHHDGRFDLDEQAMTKSCALLSAVTYKLLNK